MEPYGVLEVGGQSDGGILQLFSAQLSFLRLGSKRNMFPGKFFCFHSATAANGAINCHYPSIKPPHWVIVTLPTPFDAF